MVKVPPERRDALKEKLEAGAFEWRTAPHAQWSVKGEGVVATLYDSGKLVVQGSEPERFLVRFTDEPAPTPPRPLRPVGEPVVLKGAQVGAACAGKADYFGPLVIASARIQPDHAGDLSELNIKNLAQASDTRILRVASILRDRIQHEVRRVDPSEYNRLHADRASKGDPAEAQTQLLIEFFAKTLRRVVQPGDPVVVDQFGSGNPVKKALDDLPNKVTERVGALDDLAVAAAWVLARAEYLLAIMEFSEKYDIELPAGGGTVADQTAEHFLATHGETRLSQVAKWHFKNTEKIGARRSG